MRFKRKSDIESLLEETQKLREELMKTSGHLEAFSEQLLNQIQELKQATADEESGHEGLPAVEGSPHPPSEAN